MTPFFNLYYYETYVNFRLFEHYNIIFPDSGGMGTRNRNSGTRCAMEKWIEGKLNNAFRHFLPYLMIFQRFTRH